VDQDTNRAPDNENEAAFPEETHDQSHEQERVDWKAEAIRAKAQLEMLNQRSQAPASPPPPSEVEQLQQEVESLRGSMPQLDPSKPNTFWEREQHKEKLDAVREKLADARERERQNAVRMVQYQTQAQQAVQTVKQQYRDRPAFAKVEKRFDQYVKQLRPEAQADPNALNVIMRNLLFQEMDNTQAPPGAPSGAYAPRSGAPQKKGQPQFQSEAEAQVAAYYGMTAEEYYADKYNKAGPETQGNGVNVYPFPIGGRR